MLALRKPMLPCARMVQQPSTDHGKRLISTSSVSRALAVAGDRWSLLILAAAFQGVRRFEQWRTGIGIASNILSARLGRFVRVGCLRKVPATGTGRRKEYRLTEMGAAFYPTALMFWRFDGLWSQQRKMQPVTLTHETCGATMMPVLVCGHCMKQVQAREVRYEDGPGAGLERMPPPKASRRSTSLRRDGLRLRVLVGESMDYFGDRWTQQILATFFLGARRFGDVRARSKAATNILAGRLKLLVSHGMLQRRVYQNNPVRYEYVLTPKGMDVYPICLTLMKWGDRWLAGSGGAPLILYHKPCGQRLDPLVVCDQCQAPLDYHEVDFPGR